MLFRSTIYAALIDGSPTDVIMPVTEKYKMQAARKLAPLVFTTRFAHRDFVNTPLDSQNCLPTILP